MQVMPTGQALLDLARKDPVWRKMPVGHSVKAGNGSSAQEFQFLLMKQAQQIADLYTIFNTVRKKETGEIPAWARNAGTRVLL